MKDSDAGRLKQVTITLREKEVVLDADLAAILGIETRLLNQHIRRHQELFDGERLFRITEQELEALRSQAVISNSGRGGRRSPPMAFTVRGLRLLADILPERLRHPWLKGFLERAQEPAPRAALPGTLAQPAPRPRTQARGLAARQRAAREAELDHLLAILAEKSLREYIQQAWPILEPGTPFTPGWHIDAIAEHLEAVSRGEIRKLLINMPPRHMKSLSVSVFWPTWEWIRRPELGWLFASYAMSLAVRDSVKCRRIIESPWYQHRWGQAYQLAGDQNAKSRYENTKTGYRISLSVDSAVTGEGADRLVVDDPHNVREAESDAVRSATIAWWRESMSTRINNPKTVTRVVVMQRVHEEDLAGYLLAEEGDWEHLCLPAEYEPKLQIQVSAIGWQDPRTEPGELLWPQRFGPKELADLKKTLGSYGVAGQLQQRPSPAGGGMLKRFWWRYWCYPGQNLPPVSVRLPEGGVASIKAVPLPGKFDETIQSWDATFKDTKASDYVVGQVWARKGADKFALDQVRARMDFPATVAAVRALTANWPAARLKLVEDKANGPAVIATLKHEIPGIVPVSPQGSKEARAAAVSPDIEAGNVYLPHPSLAPWVDGFVDECATFPAAAHDDQVDAMTQALIRIGTGRVMSAWDVLDALSRL